MLLASLNWGFGTILVKKFDWDGMSVLALDRLAAADRRHPDRDRLVDSGAVSPILLPTAWPALAGLGYAVFIAMVFCHTAYFKLVSLLPAHVAAMGVMAVPVVGVISSIWILGESAGWPEWLALAFVVTLMLLLMLPEPAPAHERA